MATLHNLNSAFIVIVSKVNLFRFCGQSIIMHFKKNMNKIYDHSFYFLPGIPLLQIVLQIFLNEMELNQLVEVKENSINYLI